MTYVREQSSTELAVHMRSLQKMPGWHDPLADRLWQEVEALKAEVAGLRTGYEAYEQVNAELKAENERLERNRDMWKGQVERQAEEMTALRKDADRYRWLRVKQTFIWLIQDWLPSNAVLTDVDAEIDAAMSKRAQSRAT